MTPPPLSLVKTVLLLFRHRQMMLLLLGLAHAAELRTCGDTVTEGCLDTLAEAVEAAEDGDTILMGAGTYADSLHLMERELVLEAEDGPGTVLWTEPPGDDPFLEVVGGSLELQGLDFFASRLRILQASEDAELVVQDSTVNVGSVLGAGGAITMLGGSIEVLHSTFSGGQASGQGGHLYAMNADVTLVDSTFEDGTSLDEGGALYVDTEGFEITLTVQDCLFEDNQADVNFGAIGYSGHDVFAVNHLLMEGSTFRGNASEQNGAVYSGFNQTAVMRNNRFENNSASAGGILRFDAISLELHGNIFCGNHSEKASTREAATWIRWAETFSITNNIWVDNENGALSLTGAVVGEVRNNHFVGNSALTDPALYIESTGFVPAYHVSDNLFAYNVVNGAGLAPAGDATWVTWDTNIWWGNVPEQTEVRDPSGIFEDPGLDDYVADGTCSWGLDDPAPVELWPSWEGAARDAGSGDSPDLDGSAPDIGAFGGPGARNEPDWLDADDDGVPTLYDCAPGDPDVSPAQEETPYDGVDTNCDSFSDYDADRDGQESREHGGPDCDDNDATIYQGAEETPYDGIDQNCDGSDLVDVDGDGYALDQDCDDNDSSINPGAVDGDAGVDRDCDGFVDLSQPLGARGCSQASPRQDHQPRLALLTLAGLLVLRRRRRP